MNIEGSVWSPFSLKIAPKKWIFMNKELASKETLFNLVESFTKLSNRVSLRLREYGYLITELLSDKEDENLPGFVFLQTARGLHLLVAKLLFPLQKWITVSSKYNNRHWVPFPHFSISVNFVTRKLFKLHNHFPIFQYLWTLSNRIDLRFTIILSTGRFPLHENKSSIVLVNMIDMSPTAPNFTRWLNKKDADPTHHCPWYKTPHSLLECRVFHEKSQKEHKTLRTT